MIVFLLLLGFSAPAVGPFDEVGRRAVRVGVEAVDGTELAGAIVTVCGKRDGSSEDVVCEEEISRLGGFHLLLQPNQQYTLRANLDGFLTTEIGPVVVTKSHNPPEDLLLVLNTDIQE